MLDRTTLLHGADPVSPSATPTAPSGVRAARPRAVRGVPRAPRLSAGADPCREVTVSWETEGPVDAPTCELLGPDGRSSLVPATSRGVSGSPTVYHHARLHGLEPGTTYRYRPRQHGAGGRAGSFTTAPAGGPMRLTTFGDQGTGPQAAVSTARVAALAPHLHLHLGDLCYADPTGTGRGGPPDQAVWDAWTALVSPQAGRAPWLAIAGNHEMEPGQGPQGYDGLAARLALPGNGLPGAPHTWWLRLGGLAIVALDGNDWSTEHLANRDWTGGEQERWLADVLATLDADPDVTHVVVAVHGCPYSANAGHGSDLGLRERLVPSSTPTTSASCSPGTTTPTSGRTRCAAARSRGSCLSVAGCLRARARSTWWRAPAATRRTRPSSCPRHGPGPLAAACTIRRTGTRSGGRGPRSSSWTTNRREPAVRPPRSPCAAWPRGQARCSTRSCWRVAAADRRHVPDPGVVSRSGHRASRAASSRSAASSVPTGPGWNPSRP